MNKIHKTKWNANTQSWVACSELTAINNKKGKSRNIKLLLATFALCGISNTAVAASCGPYSNDVIDAALPCVSHPASNTSFSANGGLLLVGNSATINKNFYTANNDIVIGSETDRKTYTNIGSTISGGGWDNALRKYTTITMGNLDLYLDGSLAGGNSYAGAGAGNTGALYIENFKLDIDKVNNGDINGLIAGLPYNTANPNGVGLKNYVHIGNNYNFKAIKADVSNTNPVTGIRAIQNNDGRNGTGLGPQSIVTIDGKYSADINAAYGLGVYVSGKWDDNPAMPTVNLNDTDIKLTNSGNAFKIGKKKDTGFIGMYKGHDGWGAGQINIKPNGTVIIDTTEANGQAISILYDDSVLDASKAKLFNVKSKNEALVVGNDIKYSLMDSTKEIKVSINNALFEAPVDNSSSLLKVDRNQKNITLDFSSDDASALTAAKDGYLFESDKNSNAVFSFSGNDHTKSVMTGASTQADDSTTVVNVNQATWKLGNDDGSTGKLLSTLTELNLNNNAVLDAAIANGNANFSIVGNVNATNSTLSLDNTNHDQYNDVLTIDGDYSGSNSLVKMNTSWDAVGDEHGANSASDLLHITGTATGSTAVIPIGTDGTESIIDGSVQQIASLLNTLPVVTVDKSGANVFSGTAKTTGATEVQLAKRTDGNGDVYYWTMNAKPVDPVDPPVDPVDPPVDPVDPPVDPVDPPVDPVDPPVDPVDPPVDPVDPPVDPAIYSPTVPAYIQMPRANMELGYATLGTLHERRGENQTLAWDECGSCGSDTNGQTWARIFGKKLKQDGKNRLNMDTDMYGFQIGHDFSVNRNDKGGHRLTGGYLAYGHSETDFSDKYRAVGGLISTDKHTGKGKTESVSLGLTNTYYTENGSYLDLVGQLSYLRNKYESRDDVKVKQNGWGAALSAEIGRPLAITEHSPGEAGWLIEPQAQLIYQYVDLKNFNDGVRKVNQGGQHGLRGRIGVRAAHNSEGKNQQTKTLYAVANIWHDFINPKAVNIGKDSIKEKYASTWGEIGLGIQLPVAKHSYLYGDARYEHGFGSTKHEGYRGTVGFKHTWK